MSVQRQKFATQMDAKLLADLRGLSEKEGRQIQSILEEAVEMFLAEKGYNRARPEVLDLAKECMERFPETLTYLAK